MEARTPVFVEPALGYHSSVAGVLTNVVITHLDSVRRAV